MIALKQSEALGTSLKFKIPVRTQITIVFATILLISFLFNFAINNIYLEEYYFNEKEYTLTTIFVLLNNPDTTNDEIYNICKTNNISVLSVSSDLEEKLRIALDGDNSSNNDMLYRILYLKNYNFEKEVTPGTHQTIRVYDEVTKIYYLELFGRLSDGGYFLIRTPVSSITDSVATINNFSYFSFILCICLGIILINILSNLITYPIERLCSIALKMGRLDFSEMHTESQLKEVDELGMSLNQLSLNLQETMSELNEKNNQLETEIKEKIQIDDMRKEFISNISHELKTPIAIIQGYAEGLSECTSDEDRDFYCEVIVDESRKMDTMVKQLIELNKLEFGIDDGVMVEIPLYSLVESVVKSIEILSPDTHIEIDGDPSVKVLFDEFKLQQIITNYLTNALHYADENKQIKVFIKDGDLVRLSVFNSGKPISNENISRIWEKFYKIDKARTRTYGGSGIGLSIVAAIMNKYGEEFGCVNVENGVEFFVKLRKP